MTKSLKNILVAVAVLLLGTLSSPLFAQSRTVSGVVLDDKGEPLFGAFVVQAGTTNGVSADFDGRYSLTVPQGTVTLQFQFIGYKTVEIPVPANQAVLNVNMEVDANLMEEVVVTAFATQKKVNVTGAISSVNGSDILAAPVANISNALVGNTPGVAGLQTSGEPGRNGTDIKVRGISTYGSSAPLIIIDGVEQAAEQAFAEFNAMDANEIQGISVLKDAASTAVYGVRGANGVIIVTTKRGSVGKPTINFSANYGLTAAANLQEGTTAYEWALMRNEAIRNEQRAYSGTESLSAYIYDDYDLWKFKNNRDFTPQQVEAMNLTPAQKEELLNSPALYYASHNNYKEQFSKVAPQYQANLNVSGGTDRVKYFVSFGFFRQEGVTNAVSYYGADTRSQFNRYNFRSNFDIKVTDNTTLTVNAAGQFGETQGPGKNADPSDMGARYKIIMQYVYDCNPFISPGIIDGKLVNGYAGQAGSIQNPLATKTDCSIGNQNPVYNLLNSGMTNVFNSLLDGSIKLNHRMDYLTKGLNAHITASYQDNYSRLIKWTPSLPTYTIQRNAENPNIIDFFGGSTGAGSFESYGYSNWNKLYIEGGFDWAGSFGKHNISALLLGKASKYTMPGDNYHVPSGIMGFVGRVTYNYDDRYMAEVNAGYNGTEQFIEGKRFGFFPAVSFGWVPTAEPFFPKNDIVTFIKIRGSYGEVGNDQLGGSRRYYYLPNTYNLNQGGYYLGTTDGSATATYFAGAKEGTLGNQDITWERARKYDAGVETKFFRDRLSVDFDYFYESRNNILTTLGTIPAIYGVDAGSVPPANVGETMNKGYEIVANWSDKKGDFYYNIGGNISYSRNKIIFKAEAQNPWPWMNQTGFSIGQRFGLVSDGLFNTEEELANRPYNTYTSNKATLGDIRYKDLDGDGLINQNDRAPIGFPNYAQYHFAIKAQFGYKGFDMKLLFTGSLNGSYYLNSGYTIPFYKNGGNAWKWQYDGRWTEAKYLAGETITYPRAAYSADNSHNNYLESDYWMVSTNHIKLKNIEAGYTFDLSKGGKDSILQALRIYFNANNVYTFKNALTKYGIDPETTDGSTYIYPLTQVYTLGVSFKF